MKIGNISRKQFVFSTLIATSMLAIGLSSTKAIASIGQQTTHQTPSLPTNPTTPTNPATTDVTNNAVFNSGVFNVGADYHTTLGVFVNGGLAGYLGSEKQHAVALQMNTGAKLKRANATYGFALTDNQRVKVSYDYLMQYHDFDFNLGDVNHWVSQHAVGGAYAYLFDNRYVESIEVGGYYSHSPSQTLSNNSKLTDTYLKTEQRHIAGANSWHADADLVLRLWPHSRLSGGVDYDHVQFDIKNRDNNKSINGIGGHVYVEQRLLPQLKITGGARFQAQQREYLGSVGWLLPSPHGMQLELEAVTDYVDNTATHRHFFVNGARLSVALGNSTGRYDDLGNGQQQRLLTWVRKPAVRMNDVLAIADGKTAWQANTVISQQQPRTPPAQSAVSCADDGTVITCNATDANGNVWSGTVNDPFFDVNNQSQLDLLEVAYSAEDGASVTFVDSVNKTKVVTLKPVESLNIVDVVDTDDMNWDFSTVDNTWDCTGSINQCQFFVLTNL